MTAVRSENPPDDFMPAAPEVGDRVKSKPGTLAYIAGDRSGTIERIEDGETPIHYVRMDQSGRLTPFREDQFE